MKIKTRQFWHESSEDEVHEQVFQHVQQLDHAQRHIHESNLCHARLYSNRFEPGLDHSSRGQYRSGYAAITENVLQSVIDTATALIGRSRPKVTLQTDGGDWGLQQLARKVESFLLNEFRRLSLHDKMTMVFRDACIFGTGALKMMERDGKVYCERTLISEIIVDETTVPSSEKPRELFQIKRVSRETLKGMFPDKADEIEMSGQTKFHLDAPWRRVDNDMVVVIEAWHIPKTKGAKGRHSIVVDNTVLFDDREFSDGYFPFVFFRWSNPLTGFYGQGLCEGLIGYQIRINELNDFIRRAQDLISIPRVFIPHGSKVIKQHINLSLIHI